MRCIVSVFILALAALACAGCYHRPTFYTAERSEQGLVVVLPGIEGRSPLNRDIVKGLADAKVPYSIDLEDWTSWLGPLYNQRAELRNRRRAAQIAINISEYKFAHPDNPVFLIGQSGGGAMAIWIAESMPEGQDIDGIVLLAPALSPGYMVDYALSKTKRGIVNFYSERDWILLGVGTTVAGTMDGRHTSSAGRVGFNAPRPEQETLYQKLFQVGWQKQMAEAGNTGTHLSSSAEAFIADYVAPLLLAREWNQQVLDRILSGWKPAPKLPPADEPEASR